MWTAGFRFSWSKMETTAQDGDGERGGDEWSVAMRSTGSDKA